MATLVLGTTPPELEALMERRKRAGLDQFDEVWEGVLHMVPAPNEAHARLDSQLVRLIGPAADAAGLFMSGQFNLGESIEDFRVPDAGVHRAGWGTWAHTAEIVIEILSPEDETWQKLPFYAAHQVDEVLIVDPEQRAVHWRGLAEGEYQAIERSGLIELGPAQLAQQISWP